MEKDLQKLIQEAVQKSIDHSKDDILNKPIFEFVATYDAGTFTRYINN